MTTLDPPRRPVRPPADPVEPHPDAIAAAEKRGEERERARCLAIVKDRDDRAARCGEIIAAHWLDEAGAVIRSGKAAP